MTSSLKGQHLLSTSQQIWNRSRWGIALGITLFGVLLVAPAQAATFMANSPSDEVDANPGNGICATAGGLCTLRAAIAESNALPGADQIIFSSPNVYLLTIVTELAIVDHLTITGGGAATTIIDGNKSVRPDSGVLKISVLGARVNLSGVTIRKGARTGDGGGISNAYGKTQRTYQSPGAVADPSDV